MIYDTISNIGRYKGISANLDTAIAYLETHDLTVLPKGRNEVDGDKVFINHLSYETAPKTPESSFEDHIAYLDLHMVTEGRENFLVAPAETLAEAKQLLADDAVLYTGDARVTVPLEGPQFVIVFPGEAHLPKVAMDEATHVEKLVFKILL